MPKDIDIVLEQPRMYPKSSTIGIIVYAALWVVLFTLFIMGGREQYEKEKAEKAMHQNCPHVHVIR